MSGLADNRTIHNVNESDEYALAWAANRKRADETVVISTCPCCKVKLAIYLKQTATTEIVPDTNFAKHQSQLDIPGM